MKVRRVIPDDEYAWFNDPAFYEPSDSDESDVRDVTPFVVRFKGSNANSPASGIQSPSPSSPASSVPSSLVDEGRTPSGSSDGGGGASG